MAIKYRNLESIKQAIAVPTNWKPVQTKEESHGSYASGIPCIKKNTNLPLLTNVKISTRLVEVKK